MKTLNETVAMGAVSLPLLIFGNLGIMALEGLIVYIQSLRLHVYEWFTKFYMGNGTRFKGITDGLTHALIYVL
jgi:Archaeal/vacuolar-type H+-ATPase subunit I